jgi:ectoine hydroxylase-related dioxygenase (phytanoyl-CoA dioxygenase family)
MTRIDCRQISGDVQKSEQVRLAYESIVRNGYVVLDHVIPAEKAASLREEFRTRYHNYMTLESEQPDTLKVGNKRYMMTLDLDGGFADGDIWGNPFVVAVVRQALGPDAILESFGAVISQPGSRQQHIHRDGQLLFDAGIAPILPAHALTFALPLIDMDQSHGSTALWPGSHRWKQRNEEIPPIAPDIPMGSCALWDFRLFHGGTPNQSQEHRPMVYATYARRWYQDPGNFGKKTLKRLIYPPKFLENVSEDRRGLLYHHVGTA